MQQIPLLPIKLLVSKKALTGIYYVAYNEISLKGASVQGKQIADKIKKLYEHPGEDK